MASHLQESKLTYFGHLRYAVGFSLKLLGASFYVLWHGIYPSAASHWKGRALIIEAFEELPWAIDKSVVTTRVEHHIEDTRGRG